MGERMRRSLSRFRLPHSERDDGKGKRERGGPGSCGEGRRGMARLRASPWSFLPPDARTVVVGLSAGGRGGPAEGIRWAPGRSPALPVGDHPFRGDGDGPRGRDHDHQRHAGGQRQFQSRGFGLLRLAQHTTNRPALATVVPRRPGATPPDPCDSWRIRA
jgi:hypothetical protein